MRITLSPLTKIAAISITVPRTFYAISNFHALSAPLPSLKPLSEFLNIQQLRQRRLRGFQVFDHFYTNYMVIYTVWAIYSFFTAKLALLIVTAHHAPVGTKSNPRMAIFALVCMLFHSTKGFFGCLDNDILYSGTY